MRLRVALVVLIVLAPLSACGSRNLASGPKYGTLTASEFTLAVDVAHHIQYGVKGTFVGATAIASAQHRTPCDVDANCPDKRLVYIRLVWTHASFTHGAAGRSSNDEEPSGGESGRSGGQELIAAVDPQTKQVVVQSAGYGPVTLGADETLLYGKRP